MAVAQAGYQRDQQIAEIEARTQAEKRNWELQLEVEALRKNQEVERKRADLLTSASVEAEVNVKEAEGISEAVKIRAEAELFSKQQEAQGIFAIREAEAAGLQRG